MSCYVRKINRPKWNIANNLKDEIDINKLNADYLASCLKTQQGEISLWKIENEDEIDDVVVAISSMGDCIDKVDVVLVTDEQFQEIGISPINQPEGNSKIRDRHYKLIDLNYEKVGKLAKVIFYNIENDENSYKRISAPKVKSLLRKALENNEIELPNNSPLLEKLKENVT